MLLKTSPSFWATLNKFMMFVSWSLLSFPYINTSSCGLPALLDTVPQYCPFTSGKCPGSSLSPNGTRKNLYLPRCVLNVVNNDTSSVRCIPKKALLPSTLENLVAPVRTCVQSPQGLELCGSLK